MSVVTNKENDLFGARELEKCSTCDRRLHFPFLHCHGGFCICGRCVQDIKRGLIADLIHVEAIMALHDLGYSDETFAREQTTNLEKRLLEEHLMREREGQKIMESFRPRPGNGFDHTPHN